MKKTFLSSCFMNKTVAMGFLASAMLLGGCSSQPEKSPEELVELDSSTPSELTSYTETVDLDIEWRSKLGNGPGSKNYRLRPVVQDDVIYAADFSGNVYSIDLESGSTNWSVSFEDDITSGVTVVGDQLFVATIAGEFFALSTKDGSQLWSQQLSSESVSPAAFDEEQVYIRTIDGKLVALARENGEQRWSYSSALPLLTVHGTSSALVVDDLVLTGFANGKVMAFDRVAGLPRWDVRIAIPEGRSELERLVDVDSAPVMVDDVIYATSYHGKISSLNIQGQTGWQSESSSYFSPAYAIGNLYVAEANDVVIAYDSYNGAKVWTQPALVGRDIGAPATIENYIAVADFEGYVHLLSQIDGEVAGRIRLRPNPIHMTLPNKTQLVNWQKLRGRDFGIRSTLMPTDKGLLVYTNIGELFLLSLDIEE